MLGLPKGRKGGKDSSFSEEKEAKRLFWFAFGKNWQRGVIAIDREGSCVRSQRNG
jgi:hypothetical protein